MIDRAQRSEQLQYLIELDASIGDSDVVFALVDVNEVPGPDTEWTAGEWVGHNHGVRQGWARTPNLGELGELLDDEISAVWVQLRHDNRPTVCRPCSLVHILPD